jgi:hypothetical protein
MTKRMAARAVAPKLAPDIANGYVFPWRISVPFTIGARDKAHRDGVVESPLAVVQGYDRNSA